MISVQPVWLGMLLAVLIVVVCVVAVTGILYLAIPPIRRFIRKDHPVWWVGDIFIAVVVAILVLAGLNHLLGARGQAISQDQQSQAERLDNLRFVRERSSVSYQPRLFRQFDLRGMNLADLPLNGANFVQADLTGANLTGTNLTPQAATPEASGTPAVPETWPFLQGVNLCHAVLTGANLQGAFLVNANLTGVDLTSTRLNGAVLNGADLSQATLPSDTTSDGSLFSGIFYDKNTVWPKGFQPPQPAAGDPLQYLGDPIAKALYGNVPRPSCDS